MQVLHTVKRNYDHEMCRKGDYRKVEVRLILGYTSKLCGLRVERLLVILVHYYARPSESLQEIWSYGAADRERQSADPYPKINVWF